MLENLSPCATHEAYKAAALAELETAYQAIGQLMMTLGPDFAPIRLADIEEGECDGLVDEYLNVTCRAGNVLGEWRDYVEAEFAAEPEAQHGGH
jgi:hypothetical protein